MNTWDFLIQKEDEQNWYFLDSLAKFKTGKFCLMAHTARAHQNIDIRITYYPESDPKTRQNQQYYRHYRRTNAEGLLSIFSSMPLASGIWEISCRPDIMGELCGEIWQQKITLEVYSNSEVQQPKILDCLTETNLMKTNFNSEENLLIESDSENSIINLMNRDPLTPDRLELMTDVCDSEEIQKQDILKEKIISNSEDNDLIPIQFRQTNHVIQLCYLECNSSIIFDIEMIESEHPSSKSLNLPDPTKMNRNLRKKYLTNQRVLPPKLYPDSSSKKTNKSIQLAKFKPYAVSV